jgi:hypothetical protein
MMAVGIDSPQGEIMSDRIGGYKRSHTRTQSDRQSSEKTGQQESSLSTRAGKVKEEAQKKHVRSHSSGWGVKVSDEAKLTKAKKKYAALGKSNEAKLERKHPRKLLSDEKKQQLMDRKKIRIETTERFKDYQPVDRESPIIAIEYADKIQKTEVVTNPDFEIDAVLADMSRIQAEIGELQSEAQQTVIVSGSSPRTETDSDEVQKAIPSPHVDLEDLLAETEHFGAEMKKLLAETEEVEVVTSPSPQPDTNAIQQQTSGVNVRELIQRFGGSSAQQAQDPKKPGDPS